MEVRNAADLAASDALIIPGGESTTMWKLLEQERLVDAIRAFRGVEADLRKLRGRDSAGSRGDASGAGEPRADGYFHRAQRLRAADR